MTSVATREASPVSRALLPEPGLYRHFKGGEYEVLEVARHSETEELLVIYCSLDDPTKIWVRPLDMFSGTVDSPEGPSPRFELMTPLKRRPYGHLTRFLLRVLKVADRQPASTITTAAWPPL
jgi:hypothetical protein